MARRLDKLVTFRRNPGDVATPILNSLGEVVAEAEPATTWPEIATARASVTPVKDGEKWRAGQVTASEIVWVLVRRTADLATVTARDALVYRDQNWSIIAPPKEVGAGGLWLEFTAERSDAEGE